MDRELLDAEMIAGHLVPPGTVFAFLAEHRSELFPDSFTATPATATTASAVVILMSRSVTARPLVHSDAAAAKTRVTRVVLLVRDARPAVVALLGRPLVPAPERLAMLPPNAAATASGSAPARTAR